MATLLQCIRGLFANSSLLLLLPPSKDETEVLLLIQLNNNYCRSLLLQRILRTGHLGGGMTMRMITTLRSTYQIDSRTMLRNDETRISRRKTSSLADDVARRISSRQLLTYPSTLLLPLRLRKQMRLHQLPYNQGLSMILLAFIAIIFRLHHVTGRS
jgi:hypothetical protein